MENSTTPTQASDHLNAKHLEDCMLWKLGETPRSLEAIEREVILKCLTFRKGARKQTAFDLGLSVRGLARKLETYQEEGFEILPSNYHVTGEKRTKPVRVREDTRSE